jgi:hypothetical protein
MYDDKGETYDQSLDGFVFSELEIEESKRTMLSLELSGRRITRPSCFGPVHKQGW